MADERGSVIAITNGSGAMLSINKYDEFGIPQAGNMGRFGYTGQTWLPEIGMNYYKARIYSPSLGRFLQTDPIGYGDGMNMYNYVGSDPVNNLDPSGLSCEKFPNGYITFVDANNNGAFDEGERVLVNGICARRADEGNIGINVGVASGGGARGVGGGSGVGAPAPAAPTPYCGEASSGSDTARIIGTGLQAAGDVATLAGLGVAFFAPPIGASMVAGGRLASTGGTLINVGADLYDGNYAGAAQEGLGLVVGSAARTGAKKLGNMQFRDSRGRFTKNNYGGTQAAKDAKQEAAAQSASKPVGQPIC